MKITMLSKEDEIPTRVLINEDIELIIGEVDNELDIQAEYPQDKYTEEEIQSIATEFMDGLINRFKDMNKEDIDDLIKT